MAALTLEAVGKQIQTEPQLEKGVGIIVIQIQR
jgi:hypothetical protein